MAEPHAMEGVYRHPAVPCPGCGHTLDAVGSGQARDHGNIAPGDYSVCIACARVLEYTAMGGYRLVSADEWRAMERGLRHELEDIIRRVRLVRRLEDPHA
jgi:ribosomal protein S27E